MPTYIEPRFTFSIMLTAAIALGSGAAVACPTVSDLTSAGIVVTYEDGARLQFRETAGGLVQNDFFFEQSDEGYWVDTLYGAYPLKSGMIKEGAIVMADTEHVNYDQPPDGLKGPTAESYWSSVATILDSDKRPRERARVAVSAETFETFKIGECVYEALPMTVLFDYSTAVMVFDYKYLDALGVAVLVRENFSGEDFPDRPEYEYEPVAIEGRSFFNR